MRLYPHYLQLQPSAKGLFLQHPQSAKADPKLLLTEYFGFGSRLQARKGVVALGASLNVSFSAPKGMLIETTWMSFNQQHGTAAL